LARSARASNFSGTVGCAWLLVGQISTVRPPQAAAVSDSVWQNWAPGRAELLLASGRPVFVDFTAAWCVTCQYNKKTVLQDPQVLAAFASKDVALLRADWTIRDPEITAELGKFGRSGVPLYVLYSGNGPAQVLSEMLSASELRATLSALPSIPSLPVPHAPQQFLGLRP